MIVEVKQPRWQEAAGMSNLCMTVQVHHDMYSLIPDFGDNRKGDVRRNGQVLRRFCWPIRLRAGVVSVRTTLPGFHQQSGQPSRTSSLQLSSNEASFVFLRGRRRAWTNLTLQIKEKRIHLVIIGSKFCIVYLFIGRCCGMHGFNLLRNI